MGTIPVDLFLNLWFGLLFAACAQAQFRAGAAPWRIELWAVLSFEIIVMWPASLYFLLVHPDWTWMYTRADAAVLSVGRSLLVLMVNLASLLLGYGLGWVLVRDRRDRFLYGGLVGVALAAAVFLLAAHQALLHAGTFREYQAGRAAALADVRLVWIVAVCTVGTALAAGAVGWTLWSQGRRPPE